MQAGLRPKPPPPPITPAECKAYLADQCTPNPTSWNRLAMYNIPGGGEHVTPRGFTDYTAEFLLTRGPYAMLGYSWCGCTNGTCTFLAIARSAAITYHAPCAGGFFWGGFGRLVVHSSFLAFCLLPRRVLIAAIVSTLGPNNVFFQASRCGLVPRNGTTTLGCPPTTGPRARKRPPGRGFSSAHGAWRRSNGTATPAMARSLANDICISLHSPLYRPPRSQYHTTVLFRRIKSEEIPNVLELYTRRCP